MQEYRDTMDSSDAPSKCTCHNVKEEDNTDPLFTINISDWTFNVSQKKKKGCHKRSNSLGSLTTKDIGMPDQDTFVHISGIKLQGIDPLRGATIINGKPLEGKISSKYSNGNLSCEKISEEIPASETPIDKKESSNLEKFKPDLAKIKSSCLTKSNSIRAQMYKSYKNSNALLDVNNVLQRIKPQSATKSDIAPEEDINFEACSIGTPKLTNKPLFMTQNWKLHQFEMENESRKSTNHRNQNETSRSHDALNDTVSKPPALVRELSTRLEKNSFRKDVENKDGNDNVDSSTTFQTNFWTNRKSSKTTFDSKYNRKTSCHNIVGLSWKNTNPSSENSETNDDLSQSSPQTNVFSSNIFRPSAEGRNKTHVSFRSYIEKDSGNPISSFETCESDNLNSYGEENSDNSQISSHGTEYNREMNNSKTNIISLKGLPPPPPLENLSKQNENVPFSIHLRQSAQTSMYPSSLDNLIGETSSSQDLLDENISNSRKARNSNEPTEGSELAQDFTNEDENGSEKQNIISLKGLPPPPPKPPRIFVSCNGHSNITLESIVTSNYE